MVSCHCAYVLATTSSCSFRHQQTPWTDHIGCKCGSVRQSDVFRMCRVRMQMPMALGHLRPPHCERNTGLLPAFWCREVCGLTFTLPSMDSAASLVWWCTAGRRLRQSFRWWRRCCRRSLGTQGGKC